MEDEASPDTDNSGGTEEDSCNAAAAWVDSFRDKIQKKTSASATGICHLIEVPDHLTGEDSDAFFSHVVNLGPLSLYHNPLDPIEDQKWRYLSEVLSPLGKRGLETLLRAIRDIEPSARHFYTETSLTRIYSIQFVTSMVLDGCFVIQILLKGTQRQHITSDDPIFLQSWLFHQVQRDLLLLPNQIPFVVLQRLFDLVAPSLGICSLSLTQLALEFFSHKMQITTTSHNHNPKHLLHLLQSNLLPGINGQMTSSHGANLKPFPGAKALREAGVEFRRSRGAVDDRPARSIAFDDGVLTIPHFSIEEDTRSLFMNLIAFEQLDPHCSAHITAYTFFMAWLVDTAEDISVLCSQGIIDNWLGDDDEAAALFKRLGRHIAVYPNDVYLADVIDRIRNYCIIQRNARPSKTKRLNKPSAMFPFGFSLIAAIFLLVLAFLQAFFAVFSYLHPILQISSTLKVWDIIRNSNQSTVVPDVLYLDCKHPLKVHKWDFVENRRRAKLLHNVCAVDIPLVPRWTRPPVGALKMNVNARCLFDRGIAGLAAIIRDSCGCFIAARGWRRSGVGESLLMEAEAFRLGIMWALQLGFSDVQMESDSLLLCTFLTNDCLSLSPVGHIIASLRSILCTNPQVSVHHVLRNGNTVAHALADIVSNSVMDNLEWWGNPPHVIIDKLCTDNFLAMNYSDFSSLNLFHGMRGSA